MSKLLSFFTSLAFFVSLLFTAATPIFAAPPDPPTLLEPTVTHNSITVRWEKIEEVNVDPVIELAGPGRNREGNAVQGPTEFTYNNLEANTTYTIYAKAVRNIETAGEDPELNSQYTPGWQVTTKPAPNAGGGNAGGEEFTPIDPNNAAAGSTTLGGSPAGIVEIQQLIQRMINLIVPAAFLILTIILFWAGIRFLTSGGDAKAISTASLIVTWALLGILFLILAWLILKLVAEFTGIDVTKFCIGFVGAKTGCTYI